MAEAAAVDGIDTFLGSQSERFFAIDGTLTEGVSWVPTRVDGVLAYDIVPGELGLGMIRASHTLWSSCVEAGLDQVGNGNQAAARYS